MAAKQNRLSKLHDVFTEMLFDEIQWYKDQEIPMASAEGTWLWDWETHTWKEVVQPSSDTTASEVKA